MYLDVPFPLWSEVSKQHYSKLEYALCNLKHKCFVYECNCYTTCAQLFQYEALGLCPEGKGGDLVDSGHWIHNRNGRSNTCMWVCGCSGLSSMEDLVIVNMETNSPGEDTTTPVPILQKYLALFRKPLAW